MALTAMIGVAIMVESFRESLREWLIHTLRADVYVSAPGPAEASERRLDPAVIRALLATPGIRDHSESRRVEVASPRGALDLNADIRALSMGIFERTFVITRVLYWLAAGVAAVALVSALLAWELERSRELAILRSLGLTPWGTALLVLAQTTFMGVAALAAAIPAGLLTALVLTGVINRRAFGWQIGLHLTPAQFTDALWLPLRPGLSARVD